MSSIKKGIVVGFAALMAASTANAALIRVSQESSVGAGDFDANVLGTISTWSTPMSSAAFYQYGTPQGASYNGEENGGPAPISNTTINFFALTSDGLTFYNVHDKPGDGFGGSAKMTWSLAGGDTAAFMVGDDGGEGLTPGLGSQDTSFTTNHNWVSCCTDGFGLGTIDGAGWELFGEFDSNTKYASESDGGIDFWSALSADGGTINLALNLDRRVRFDAVPEPSVLALFGAGLIALGFVRRRVRS